MEFGLTRLTTLHDQTQSSTLRPRTYVPDPPRRRVSGLACNPASLQRSAHTVTLGNHPSLEEVVSLRMMKAMNKQKVNKCVILLLEIYMDANACM